MFENIINFFKKIGKKDQIEEKSKDTAKERLHLVLMQDRANVSADFLDMMRQEIIEVIKKYIDVDEKDIDVRLTNKTNEDGTMGAPALYANIPITGIKEGIKKEKEKENKEQELAENNDSQEEKKQEDKDKKEENIEEKVEEVIVEEKNEEEQKEELANKKEDNKEEKADEEIVADQEPEKEEKKQEEDSNNKKANTNKKKSSEK